MAVSQSLFSAKNNYSVQYGDVTKQDGYLATKTKRVKLHFFINLATKENNEAEFKLHLTKHLAVLKVI